MDNEKQATWDLENVRQNLEDSNKSLTKSLELVKQELAQNQTFVQQLNLELQQTRDQLAAMMAEKLQLQTQVQQINTKLEEVSFFKNKDFFQSMCFSVQSVLKTQELEATNEQLEQNVYTTQESLTQIQNHNSTVSRILIAYLLTHAHTSYYLFL